MPLDALSGHGCAESLAISLAQRDIRPVDWNTLAAHKQAQLEKFGPSFWYRHQGSLGFTLIGSIGLMALTAGAANSLTQPGFGLDCNRLDVPGGCSDRQRHIKGPRRIALGRALGAHRPVGNLGCA